MFDNLRPDSTRGIRQRAKKHAEQPRTIDNMSREKHEKNYQNLILIAEAIILVCILCVTVFASAFYSLDAAICDKLYTNFRGVSNDIRIIAIDEETLEAYGNFGYPKLLVVSPKSTVGWNRGLTEIFQNQLWDGIVGYSIKKW